MKKGSSSLLFLYGIHATKAALGNPRRRIEAIYYTTPDVLTKVLPNPDLYKKCLHQKDARTMGAMLPPGAVHQGIAIKVHALEDPGIEFLQEGEEKNQCVVVLDQVTDPHNVGAILRSAAVFGARALIMTTRHAPPESGALAKAASGALELVPIIRVPNLAQAIRDLREFGFWSVGFDEQSTKTLAEVDLTGKIALMMGAEGDGLRRLTQELCDFKVRLETVESFTTLNVSTAAAIALYETYKAQCRGNL